MSDGWNIAVLDATEIAGEALINLLQKIDLPIGQLYPLSVEEIKEEGGTLRYKGRTVAIQAADTFDWSQVQLACFLSLSSSVAIHYARQAIDAGCLVFDQSGAWSSDQNIPLFVPKVNDAILENYRSHNIVALADGQTCQLLRSIYPMIMQGGISRLHVTSFMPASTEGKRGVGELARQTAHLLNGIPVEAEIFSKQLAFNVFPADYERDGSIVSSVDKEYQLVEEIRKILGDPSLAVFINCIRAPLFYGQAQSIHLSGYSSFPSMDILSLYENDHTIQFVPTHVPSPAELGEGNAQLHIGSIQNDRLFSEVIQLWTVADAIYFAQGLMMLEAIQVWIREYGI